MGAVSYDSIKYDVQRLNSDINGIKLCLYSRFNNILSASEKTKLENRINNELYRLNLDLHSKTDCLYDEVKESLGLVEQEYKEKIDKQIVITKNREGGSSAKIEV